MPEGNFIDLAQLNDERRSAINQRMRDLARLDAHFDQVRTSERSEFGGRQIPFVIQTPGGDVVRFLAYSRDLSAGGMCLLHGGFIHIGAACTVRLPMLDGRHQDLAGVVVRCALVEGRIHEIGVRFRNVIALDQFIEPQNHADAVATLEDDPLCGSLVVCASTHGPVRALLDRLEAEGVRIDIIEKFNDCVKSIAERSPDLVLLELPSDTVKACLRVPTLRSAGYARAVVAIMNGPDPKVQQRLADDGLVSCVWRGSDAETQFRIVARHLTRSAVESRDEQEESEAA